jgi:simple sugar transport system ATP-binding protein
MVPIASSSLLEVDDLHMHFGAVHALRGASLQVRRNEVTAIIGDNGAGKSTLIKCIAGVHQPSAGRIRFDGDEVAIDSPRAARDLGIETLYQDLALVDDLTVYENMFLTRERTRGIAGLRFMNRRAMLAEARTMLEAFDIDSPSPGERVRRLSGGQRQAIAIGRAVKWGSRLIVMDEPTAALGVRERKRVEGLIGRLARAGRTFLVITHNFEEVMEVGDSVYVMRQGRVVAHRRCAETSGQELVALVTGADVA